MKRYEKSRKKWKWIPAGLLLTLSLTLGYGGTAHAQTGSGTAADPYVISSAQDLNNVRNNLSAYYVLDRDIDAEAIGSFEPIGNAAEGAFTGSFDGQGHTIRNLTVECPDDKYVGLFGYSEGTLTNIKLTNMEISGSRYTGGIVGYQDGDVTNCSIQGKVTAADGIISMYAGGVAGYVKGDVSGCSADVQVMATAAGSNTNSLYAGGVAGYVTGDVSSCMATGQMVTYYATNAGGICGRVLGNVKDSKTVKFLYSDKHSVQRAGGIAGYCNGNFINNWVENITGFGSALVSDFYGDKFELQNGTVDTGLVLCDYANGSGSITISNVKIVGRGFNRVQGSYDVRFKNCSVSGNDSTSNGDGYSRGMYIGGVEVTGSYYSTVNSLEFVGCRSQGKLILKSYFDRGGAGFISGVRSSHEIIFKDCISYIKGKESNTDAYVVFADYWCSAVAYYNCTNFSDYRTFSDPIRWGKGTLYECVNYGKLYEEVDKAVDCINYSSSNCFPTDSIRCLDYSTGKAVIYNAGQIEKESLSQIRKDNRFSDTSWSEAWSREDSVAGGYPMLKWTLEETMTNVPYLLLHPGETFQLTASRNGANVKIKDTGTRDTDIATISTSGVVKAISQGSTVVTVTCEDGSTLWVPVRVEKTILSLNLPEKVYVHKGYYTDWTVPVIPEDSIQQMASAKVEDSNIVSASITDSGRAIRLTGRQTGETKLTITTIDGITGTTTVEVLSGQVTISPSELTLDYGTTYNNLSVTTVPNGKTANLNWSISDSSIAAYESSYSRINAKKIGTAVLTATDQYSGASASCVVHVTGNEVRLEKESLELELGDTAELAYYFTRNQTATVSWSSSNTSIVSVSSGTVTAKAVGDSIITASLSNGSVARCKVTVKEKKIPQESLSLSSESETMKVGDQLKLEATVTPRNASDQTVHWKSSRESVATVDTEGVVTAAKTGSTVIQAYTDENLVAECAIRVYADEGTSLYLSEELAEPHTETVSLKLGIGGNPGLASWKGSLEYDAESLTPVSVKAIGSAAGADLVTDSGEEESGIWNVALLSEQNIQGDGELLEFTFALTGEEQGDYEIRLKTEDDVLLDEEGTEYLVSDQPGMIHRLAHYLGDANLDDTVDWLDGLTLSQILAKHQEASEEQKKACDLDQNGTIDSVDLSLLLQKLDLILKGDLTESAAHLGEGTTGLILEEASAQAGDMVAVNLKASGTAGIGAAKLTLQFDSAQLTPVSAEVLGGIIRTDLDTMNVSHPGSLTIAGIQPTGAADGAVFATVRFRISENAKAGSLAVTAQAGTEFASAEGQRIAPAIQTGKLTIEQPTAREVVIDQKSLSLPAKQRVQMTASLLPAGAKEAELVWQIEDGGDKAQITRDGILTGMQPGTATIRVTLAENPSVTATQTVTITEEVEPEAILQLLPSVSGEKKVRLALHLDRSIEVSALQMTLQYDAQKLQADSVEAAEQWKDEDISCNLSRTGEIYIVWENGTARTLDGDIFYIDFTIAGELQEDGAGVSVVDYGENALCMIAPSGKIWNVQSESAHITYKINYGDVNGDGIVNVMDAYLVRRYVSRLDTPTENQKLAADVDGDGRLTVNDAYLIRRYVVRLIDRFPAEN